jgi:hypothetical protein
VKTINLIAAFFICSASAFAQGVPYDNVALLDSGRPVQGATITVCKAGSTGTPCTPLASIFSDVALSVAITQPGFQSGAQGNFRFYAACGAYDIQLSGNGLTARTMKDVQLGPCGNFAGTMALKRYSAGQGTALTASNFAINVGWGSTANVSAVVGTDQGFRFQVNSAGTGQSSTPTVTVTYADGTWTNDPILVCWRGDTNSPGPASAPVSWNSASTATAGKLIFNGTPVAGTSYIISCIAIGR